MAYQVNRFLANVPATSATFYMTPAIDVHMFDKFAIQIENNHATITAVHLQIDGSLAPAESAANAAPQWFALNTTTYPIGSAIAASAVLATIMYDNAYKYIRIQARYTTSAVLATTFVVTVGGHLRKP